MGLTAKVDIFDLIIDCLKEHEKALDGLADRLEKVTAVLERWAMR